MTRPQPPETAGILERLRQQIGPVDSKEAPPSIEKALPCIESMPPNLTCGSLEFPVNDLAPLRAEVETALSGHRCVGQINPRRPGVQNRVIQLIKKVLRRSLTWYTRPIHIFQGAVIRALQQVVLLLEGQQELSGKLTQDLSKIATQMGRANQTVADTREHVVRTVADTREHVVRQIGDIKSDISDQLFRTKTHVLGQVARTSGELSDRIDSTKADVLGQVARTSGELSDRIDSTKADVLGQVARTSGELSDRIDSTKADVLGQVARTSGELSDRINSTKANILEEVAKTNGELCGQVDSVRNSTVQELEQFRNIVDILRAELQDNKNELLEVVRQQRIRERDVRRFVDAVETGVTTLPSSPAQSSPPMFASEIKHQDEFDYFVFEDKFRGNEALIRNRQEDYLNYFRGRENVVDVGCGRGEFLELLRDNGIAARGVELGHDQFLLCREKGLDVVQQDLFSFLESLRDDSIGGLFSAQVIEHLTASEQLRFVNLAYRKSKAGSPVIFETINAQCVFAIVHNFFLDPTHVRPVHPETLKFAMESVNFRNVQLQFSSPVVDRHIPTLNIGGNVEEMEKFNFAIRQLNELIYGCQDYAAIGWH
jgi:SAM-dependent methyltransferase